MIDDWHEAFSYLLAPEAPATPPAAPIMGADMRQLQGYFSDHLSEPISPSEVASALKSLRRNKAAFSDGVRAEHLLDAQAMLLEPMTNAFMHLLLVELPDSLCRGIIRSLEGWRKGRPQRLSWFHNHTCAVHTFCHGA